MPLAPPLALLVPPLRPPPGPPPATVPAPPEAPRVVPAKLLGFTIFRRKHTNCSILLYYSNLVFLNAIACYNSQVQCCFTAKLQQIYVGGLCEADRCRIHGLIRHIRIHLNDRSDGSQDKVGARSKVAKVATSRVGAFCSYYIYIHKIKHKYRWRLISWYHDIMISHILLFTSSLSLPVCGLRSRGPKLGRRQDPQDPCDFVFKSIKKHVFFTFLYSVKVWRQRDWSHSRLGALVEVAFEQMLKLIWLRKPNDCSQTFVSLFNSHIFSPNSVCCLGVFSYSKGPGSKWDICLLEFFGANGFHL